MVDFVFKRSIFSIREMAFGSFSNTNQGGADVIYMHSNDAENSAISSDCIGKQQYTLLNDLKSSEEEILSNVKKNCRYEIRRAVREEAKTEFLDAKMLKDNMNVINDFQRIYNQMFQQKGMDSYSFNKNLVLAAVESGNITITSCEDANDKSLVVYHAYLCDGESTVLMYSASPVWEKYDKEKINAIGRMNKYLHYQDMLEFKKRMYSRYEWGGITNPVEPNGIDKFKMEFGGEVKSYYNYIVSKSLKGRLYLYLLKRRERK